MDLFRDKTTKEEVEAQRSVRAPQSVEDVRENYRSMPWMNTTSLAPTDRMERPRRGHAV